MILTMPDIRYMLYLLFRGEHGERFISEVYYKHKKKFDELKAKGELEPVDLEKLLEPYKDKVQITLPQEQ